MTSTAYYKTILRTRVLHLSTHSHPSVQHTPWEMDGGCSLWSLCETCWGSHSTRLYNGRMPDVTFDVNVIWANLILEAFGECCCEVLVLFWLWAGSAGRALGWEAAVVLNGLLRAVKFVAPLLFWDCFDVYVPSASSCCYLRIQLFSTFSSIMRLPRARTRGHQCHPLLPTA